MARYLLSGGADDVGSHMVLVLPDRGDEVLSLAGESTREPPRRTRTNMGNAIKLGLAPGHSGWLSLAPTSGGTRAPEADFMIAAAHNL